MIDLARSELVEDILASVQKQNKSDFISRDRFIVILTYTYAYVVKDESFLMANTKRSPLGNSILGRSNSGLFQSTSRVGNLPKEPSADHNT